MEFDHIEDHGTTHLSVVDKWGGVAAVTSTVCPFILIRGEIADRVR